MAVVSSVGDDRHLAGADGFGQFDLDLFACLALGHRFSRVAAGEKFIGFLAALLVDHDVAGADGFGQLGFDLLAGLTFDDRFGSEEDLGKLNINPKFWL